MNAMCIHQGKERFETSISPYRDERERLTNSCLLIFYSLELLLVERFVEFFIRNSFFLGRYNLSLFSKRKWLDLIDGGYQ